MAICADLPWTDFEAQSCRPLQSDPKVACSDERRSREQSVCLGDALRAPGSYPWLAKFPFPACYKEAEKENLQPPSQSLDAEAKSMSSSSSRTVIVFDWDDTLFPLTHVFRDLHMDVCRPLEEQPIPEAMKRNVASQLAACSEEAIRLLTLANSLGKVILVTLSRESWVVRSCRNFCPKLQDCIDSLGLPIIYAQSQQGNIGPDGAKLKAQAISGQLKGGSPTCRGRWRSIISIGDSDFERHGARLAAQDYASSCGQDESPSHVHTKTLKTMDKPTTEELTSQLRHLAAWLPLMAAVPCDLDLYLSEAVSPCEGDVEAMEEALSLVFSK